MGMNAEASVTLSLVDRITGPIKRIQARLSALSSKIGLDRIAASASNVGTAFRGLGDGIAATTGRLSALVGLMGVGAGGAIAAGFGLAKSAADVGAELTEMSFKLGVGVEALQEYRYAAKMSGVEQATLDKGLEKIGINAVAASSGNKELAKAFRTLGVSVKGANGQLRPTGEIVDATLSALADVEDPLKRNALAFKLFGKSGVDLVKMLSDGSDGLHGLRDEARRTGNVMSEAAAKLGDEFGDRLDSLMERITGLKNLLGVQLLPVFTDLIVGLTDWFDANGALVRSTIVEWTKSLSDVIKDLINPASDLRMGIDSAAQSFSAFIAAVRPVVDFIGGPLYSTLALITLWVTGPLIAALASLSAAFINLGIAILSTPVGWVAVGIAAIGAAVYVLVQRWDEFLAYWLGLWDRVRDGFKQGFVMGIITLLKEFNPVTHIVRGINAMIEYFTGVDLLSYGSAMIATLTAGISQAAQSIGSAVESALVSGWQQFEAWWEGFSAKVRAAGAAVVDAIWEGLKSKWSDVVSWMKSAIADLIGWLPESIQAQLGFTATSAASAPTSPATPNLSASYAVPTSTIQTPDSGSGAGIIAKQNQTVNAPLNVGGIVVNVQGMTPQEAQSMVSRAIANADRQRADNVASSLSD